MRLRILLQPPIRFQLKVVPRLPRAEIEVHPEPTLRLARHHGWNSIPHRVEQRPAFARCRVKGPSARRDERTVAAARIRVEAPQALVQSEEAGVRRAVLEAPRRKWERQCARLVALRASQRCLHCSADGGDRTRRSTAGRNFNGVVVNPEREEISVEAFAAGRNGVG